MYAIPGMGVQSGHDQTELGHEGKRKGEEREQNQVQQPGGPKVQRGRVTKMILLYRGGQPSPGAEEFKVGAECAS